MNLSFSLPDFLSKRKSDLHMGTLFGYFDGKLFYKLQADFDLKS